MKILKYIFFGLFFFAIIYFFKVAKMKHDSNILTVGTSLDYPPYEFVDTQTGNAAGFDIDVVTELANRMHKKLIIKNMPFTSLIFGLLTQDIDIIASGMSPTERRARMVQFTDPYVQSKPLVVISKKSVLIPESIQDLYGKRVAVNTGYIADMKMSEHSEIFLTRLESPSDCFMALQVGSVDAFVSAATNVETFLQRQAHAEQFHVFEIPGTQEICALAVNKNNQELGKEINAVLHLMREDGTLSVIQRKWNL